MPLNRQATCLVVLAAAMVLLPGKSLGVMPWTLLINTNYVVNVTSYGAVGNGVTTDTTAVQNAINAAAAGGTTNGAAGGTVEIPAGIFLSGPLSLKSSVNLQLDSGAILRMLPFGQYPLTYFTNYSTNIAGNVTNITTNVTWTAPNFISASSLHDIAINGPGAIDGQGLPWWPYANTNGDTRPIMIAPSDCNRLLIQNVTLSNSPMFHIAISGSSSANSTIQGVTVLAPSSTANPPSHNTDACDVDGTNILVQNCNISTGDDDFTCGGGTAEVLLTNNTYGNGHGVSIGSYTDDGGVSNITVVNCTFNGTENGIRIKSDNNRGGLVQNISYCDLSMTNVDFPIQVYAYYNEVGTPSGITPSVAAGEPVAAVTDLTPVYRNITFSNISATAVAGYPAILIWPRTEMPGSNIVFNRVNISASEPVEIYNASGVRFINCAFTLSSSASAFELFDAQVALTNSAPADTLFTFDGLTANGYGNSIALTNALASLINTNVIGAGPVSLDSSTLIVSNNLALFPATVLNYLLGTNPASVSVTGNLTLGGVINLTAGAGFANGIYSLLTYGKNLNGELPTLGSVPAGYYYNFNTNTAGQVALVVSSSNVPPPLAPTNIVCQLAGNELRLSWPSNYLGWLLQVQSNASNSGIGTNWVAMPNSANVIDTNFPINPSNGSVFFRMIYP